jgi:ribosomal protein L3 glutamine methyltransferase
MTMSNHIASMTVHQMIETVSDRLEKSEVYCGHGTDNISDESVALVFQVLKLPFDEQFEEKLQHVLTMDQIDQVMNVLDKRIRERKPLPYLIRQAYFAGLPFYVDERVIIPRSPMAELIERAFEPWIDPNHVHSILDLCTGSGCIAVACASVFPDAKVDAVDISLDALKVAKINVEKHHVSDQVNLIQSDLFDNLKDRKYDIVISNPPYVSQDELQALPQEYKYEPQAALLAENSGLAFIVRILQSAISYLTDHGILIVEVGGHQEILEKRFPKMPFLWLEFERGESSVFLLTTHVTKTSTFESE